MILKWSWLFDTQHTREKSENPITAKNLIILSREKWSLNSISAENLRAHIWIVHLSIIIENVNVIEIHTPQIKHITSMKMLCLTHWGRVTHICVRELTSTGSDNGLSAGRQAIIWNNAWLLLIEPLGTNFGEISIGIQTFSFRKMHLNMSSAKWSPFCRGSMS